MSEIFKDCIGTAKSNKTRIYVITYLIINEILTKVTKLLFCMFWLHYEGLVPTRLRKHWILAVRYSKGGL